MVPTIWSCQGRRVVCALRMNCWLRTLKDQAQMVENTGTPLGDGIVGGGFGPVSAAGHISKFKQDD